MYICLIFTMRLLDRMYVIPHLCILIILCKLCLKQIEFASLGVEDFALYLPDNLIPSKRVLLLRYKNRFEALAQSLEMRGISVTSAYPLTWMKKKWNSDEERHARNVDGRWVGTVHSSIGIYNLLTYFIFPFLSELLRS